MGSLPQLSIVKGPQRELSPKYLHRLFESQFHSHAHKTALSYIEDIKLNPLNTRYSELNENANQIARLILSQVDQHQLRSNQDGDWIVSICMQPTDKLVTVLLAIWKAGAAYLPMDPSFPAARMSHIRKEAQPFLIICDDNVAREQFEPTVTLTVTECFERCRDLSKDNISSCDTVNPIAGDLAIVLYTSGSTGVPKGVRLHHAVILNRLQWQWNRFPYAETEVVGCFKTALTFVDSVSEIWGPLLNGMRVLVIPKRITKDPELLVEILDEYKIERLVLVPTLLRTLLMYLSITTKPNALKCLKSWICSGEPLSLSLAKEFYNYFEEGKQCLFNYYGSTEVMGDVTYFACESPKQLDSLERIPIGYPVDNTVIYLLDSDFRPVKSGEIGEIYVSGLNLANGYVNGRDPHRFLKNPLAVDNDYSRLYRTGDFGSISKGAVMFEGRTDSQIKIRGHRVDLSEVEKNLLTLEVVDKAMVLCYNPGEIDQALVGFITLQNSGDSYSGLDIERQLKDKLTDYMIPQIIVMDSIPLLVNGKVDRQHLLKLYAESTSNNNNEQTVEIDYSGVPDQLVHVAQDLFGIVAHVIGKSARTKLSIASNFYEMGGNSLNSIFTVTQLREKGYFISITEFIAAENFGEILEKLSATEITLQDGSHDKYLKMSATPLMLQDMEVTIDIITSSFYGKADLEQWLKDEIHPEDYADILREIWEALVEKGFSFMVRDESGRAIGAALNFDARDEPPVDVKSKLNVIFEFLEFLEGPIRDNILPPGLNRVLHSFMMGTIAELNAQENVAVINFMEDQVLDLAKRKNFAGIFTTNTNPLTQQLGTNVYNYEIMLDYQVNEYVHENDYRPFGAAPDSQRAIVHWKDVRSV